MGGTTRLVTSGSAQLCTEAFGAADKGTILLVMGATASMDWWPEDLVSALVGGGYRVIRFDHRDTGASSHCPSGAPDYDLAELTGDLVAILDAYEVDAAHIVGMSLGGYVGQILALTQPQRVKTLTLISAEPLGIDYEGEGLPEPFLAHFGALGDLDWSDREAVMAFMLGVAELSAGPRHQFDRAAAEQRISREMGRASSLQSAFNHSMIAGTLPTALTAADIGQKVLLIHGENDPIISANAARRAQAVMPDAELLIIPGLGHELVAADMPLFAEAILAHCAKVA